MISEALTHGNAYTPAAADLEQLWHEYHRDIARYIGARTEPDMVDDLVQDVFAKAWSAMLRGSGYVDCARNWLYRIAHNRVADHYRYPLRMADTIDLDALDIDPENGAPWHSAGDSIAAGGLTPHELAERAITCQCVRRAVDRLPDNYARVINLRLEGYEFSEIATEIGAGAGAAKQIGHRAYVKLQAELRGEL